MIRVPFEPSTLAGVSRNWWDQWQARADKATSDVIKAWDKWKEQASQAAAKLPQEAPKSTEFKPAYDAKVWKDLRDWLLDNVFNGKCAYCETLVVRNKFHGEHFRPKDRVRVKVDAKKGKKKLVQCKAVNEDGHEQEHPGYFWLAYNWKNLLPSCQFCNTINGKGDQFPVEASHIAIRRLTQEEAKDLKTSPVSSEKWVDIHFLQPEDLDTGEQRLLLHPYYDDTTQHLIFGEKGTIAANKGSLKGKHSIEVYDLAGEDVRKARQREQEKAWAQYLVQMAHQPGAADDAKRAAIAGYYSGMEPYSMAVLDYLHAALKDSPLKVPGYRED
jgi:hypothetical protein